MSCPSLVLGNEKVISRIEITGLSDGRLVYLNWSIFHLSLPRGYGLATQENHNFVCTEFAKVSFSWI